MLAAAARSRTGTLQLRSQIGYQHPQRVTRERCVKHLTLRHKEWQRRDYAARVLKDLRQRPLRHGACIVHRAMDPITAIAASGLRARMESLELLANNIANASTGGYKADREFYSLYSAAEAQDDPLATMPVIERPWIDHTQGASTPPAIRWMSLSTGKGFFAVNGPADLYIRATATSAWRPTASS